MTKNKKTEPAKIGSTPLLDRLEMADGPYTGPIPHPQLQKEEWDDLVTYVARRVEHLGVTLGLPTVGEQFLIVRLARGLTQTQVAERVGLRVATVADVEARRGKGANAKLDTLRAIARALDMAPTIFQEQSATAIPPRR